jgi:nucleotide-binding universal stress UspA family protein
MFNQMLVPLDGSEVSQGILPWVSYVARHLDVARHLESRVVLLAVMDPHSPPLGRQHTTPGFVRYMGRLPFMSFAADEQYYTGTPARSATSGLPTSPPQYQYDFADNDLAIDTEEEMAQLYEWLRRHAAGLEEQGVNIHEVNILTARDKPSDAIVRFALDRGCDCIAMASHQRNFLERALKGSVTSGVIRSSPMPVLAMTPEKQPDSAGQAYAFSGLTVLLDGSAFAQSALPYAKDLARRMDLGINLIRWVTSTPDHSEFTNSATESLDYGSLRPSVDRHVSQGTDEAARYLQGIADDLSRHGLRVRWDVPGLPLTSAAAELPQRCADSMIVLASHTRSGLSRWMKGSVAEELVRNSSCPVLIIPSALTEDEDGEQPG